MQAHERKALSQARLEHAVECLSAARNLLETGNYKSAANRSASGHFPALRQTAPAPVPDKRLDRVGGAEYNEKNPGKKGKPNERKPKAPEGSPQGYPA